MMRYKVHKVDINLEKDQEKLEQFLDQTFQYSYRDLISKGDFEKRSIVNLYYFWQMQEYINSLK